MIFNDSAEGNGVAVKDLKHHDGVEEGNLEMLPKLKRKMYSNSSSERNGAAIKDLKEPDAVNEDSLEVPLR